MFATLVLPSCVKSVASVAFIVREKTVVCVLVLSRSTDTQASKECVCVVVLDRSTMLERGRAEYGRRAGVF